MQDVATKKHKHEGSEARSEPDAKMKRKPYEAELRTLQAEFVALQQWVKATGAKLCVLFEGRDSAGKGGTIKALTDRVSPRVFRVVALPSPTEREKSQMYVQRYIPHLPAAVVRSDDKRRGRLNLITHLLSQVPYEPLERKAVTFPKRQAPGDYAEPALSALEIPTPF